MVREYKIISSDTHLEVNPEYWTDRIPKHVRHLGPRLVPGPMGGQAWIVEGMAQPEPLGLGLNFCAGLRFQDLKYGGWSYEDKLPGMGLAKERVENMDEDGVDADVLYPGVAGPKLYSQIKDKEAQAATVRAYNDFLNDFIADYPDRFIGIGMIPGTGIEDAMIELEHLATLPNIRAVYPHTWPAGNDYPAPEDDRFWERVQDLDVRVSAHITFGGGPAAQMQKEGVTKLMSALMAAQCPDPAGTIAQLICQGVMDRFPKIQFMFGESGTGWAPYFLEQMDDRYMRHRYWTSTDVKEVPSTYFHRQVNLGFQIDKVALRNLDVIGEDRIMWANDFPHVVTDWPNSRRVITEQFFGVSEDTKAKILAGNAVRFYRLDK